MTRTDPPRQPRRSSRTRDQTLLGVAGVVYLFWWCLVELTLPGSFNPLAGRLLVVGYFFAALVATRRVPRAAGLAAPALRSGAWLLTLHYFYLFHHNAHDFQWVIGCFVTVAAVAMLQFSATAIVSYAVFTVALGAALTLAHPELQRSIFLPGLATVMALSSVGIVLRARSEARLVEAGARFRTLFDGAFEGIALHAEGVVLDVNPAFAALFGYAGTDLIGRPVLDLLDAGSRDAARAQIDDGATEPYEAVGARRDGTTFPMEVQGKAVTQNGRALRLVAVRDLTDRRRAEREAVAAQSARRALQIRGEFISIASHELRTPLTSAKLLVQSAVRRAERADAAPVAPDEAYKLLRSLDRQIDRLGRLVEDMLDVSRIDEGKLLLRRERVDLVELARGVVAGLEPERARWGCEVRVEASEPVWLEGDRFRLEQALANLLTNAFKYGGRSAVEVRVARRATGEACLTVADRGGGIAPDKLEAIFERFERGVTADHVSGLGLGLFITREIAAAHGGRVSAANREGGGAEFTLLLPAG